MDRQDEQNLRKAITCFQQAAERDPSFARSYVALGHAYGNLAIVADSSAKECFSKAEASVRRAIELDPKLAEGWSALGWIKTKYGWDLPEAERLLRYAVQLSPTDVSILHNLATCLSDEGKADEAIALHKKVLESDPVSLAFNRRWALTLFQARRYDEALAAFQKTVELHSQSARAWHSLGMALAHVRRDDEAMTALLKAERLSGVSDLEIEAMQRDYALGGMKTFWAKKAIRSSDTTNRHMRFTAAEHCTSAGDYPSAIQWLEKLYEEPLEFARIKVWPVFDPLRSDPRFIELLHKTGLDK